jgi:hypothetical protein
MKQVSLGGLDVSWLGLGAVGMSAFAENANRGDHAPAEPVAHVHAALLLRSGVPGPSECEPSRVSAPTVVTDPRLSAAAYLPPMKTVRLDAG